MRDRRQREGNRQGKAVMQEYIWVTGIILKQSPVGEYDRHISLLSKERGKICHIEATIICERESHKGIVIGKGGEMLKKIGSMARPDIEKMLEMQVNLKLWVKVKKDWRDSDFLLRNYGYNPKDISGGE